MNNPDQSYWSLRRP